MDGTKALDSVLQRHGYSRNKRPDCLQVVVALVLTPDGFPLAYEAFPGNTSDKGTQMAFVRKLEVKYGQIGNLWLMDRGVPTEETLREMVKSNYHYLVGAPHGHLKVLGDRLEKAEWVEVQPGIREARTHDEGTYLLRTNLTDCDSKPLWNKYMIQGEIKYDHRELKNDLGLGPVYHRLDNRIEAHIFAAFMAPAGDPRAIARARAPGPYPAPAHQQVQNPQDGQTSSSRPPTAVPLPSPATSSHARTPPFCSPNSTCPFPPSRLR